MSYSVYSLPAHHQVSQTKIYSRRFNSWARSIARPLYASTELDLLTSARPSVSLLSELWFNFIFLDECCFVFSIDCENYPFCKKKSTNNICIMPKPNERSCGLMSDFPGKIVGVSPMWHLFFVVAKFFFSNFPKKCWFFSIKLTVKNFRNFFQWIQQ